MARSDSSLIPLAAHPHTPSAAVRHLAARAEGASPGSLRFEYVLEADLRSMRVPPPARGGARAEGLWAHTCFEAFVGLGESPRYLELNFSPSGEWAAYRFDSYRRGMAPAEMATAPRLALRRTESELELHAEVCLSGTPADAASPAPGHADRRLRIALAAVVEDRQGTLSYWALRHPPGQPDFHHPHGFALALQLPRKASS